MSIHICTYVYLLILWMQWNIYIPDVIEKIAFPFMAYLNQSWTGGDKGFLLPFIDGSRWEIIRWTHLFILTKVVVDLDETFHGFDVFLFGVFTAKTQVGWLCQIHQQPNVPQ